MAINVNNVTAKVSEDQKVETQVEGNTKAGVTGAAADAVPKRAENPYVIMNAGKKPRSSSKRVSVPEPKVVDMGNVGWGNMTQSDSLNNTKGSKGAQENRNSHVRVAYSPKGNSIHFSPAADQHLGYPAHVNIAYMDKTMYIAEDIPGCTENYMLSFKADKRVGAKLYSKYVIEEMLQKIEMEYPEDRTSICMTNVELVVINGVNAVAIKAN